MAAEEGAAAGAGDGGGPPPAPGQEAKKNPKVEWSKDYNELLRELVRQHGDNCWGLIRDLMIPAGRRRSGKSCRNRWTQHLDPSNIRKRRCLRLFPVRPGFHHQKPAPPLASGEDDVIAGPGRPYAVPECLELFPLAPGDVRDNDASAAAAMDVDSEAVHSLTELGLAPAEGVAFDVMPLQALHM